MRLTNYLVTLLTCVAALAAAPGGVAAENPAPAKKRVKYVPPAGFAAHKWGDLQSTFTRLGNEPFSVGAAWMRAAETETPQFQCVPLTGTSIDGAIDCDLNATLASLRRKFEGGGFYVLSEYRIPEQGFRFGDDGPVLYPVLYQFCANWDEVKRDVPPDFAAMNKFCGMRMLFKSESREELRKLPDDHVTHYDRVLQSLLDTYGRPSGFMKRGRVTIETAEGESGDPSDRRFSTWRWCPAKDRALAPGCEGSVVLSFDPQRGQGTVLLASRLLWEYAYAREKSGFKDDALFRMMHARE
jgi:hypothetical protein